MTDAHTDTHKSIPMIMILDNWWSYSYS